MEEVEGKAETVMVAILALLALAVMLLTEVGGSWRPAQPGPVLEDGKMTGPAGGSSPGRHGLAVVMARAAGSGSVAVENSDLPVYRRDPLAQPERARSLLTLVPPISAIVKHSSSNPKPVTE